MTMYKGIIVTTLSGFPLTGLAVCEKKGKAISEAASSGANEASEVTESIEKKMGE